MSVYTGACEYLSPLYPFPTRSKARRSSTSNVTLHPMIVHTPRPSHGARATLLASSSLPTSLPSSYPTSLLLVSSPPYPTLLLCDEHLGLAHLLAPQRGRRHAPRFAQQALSPLAQPRCRPRLWKLTAARGELLAWLNDLLAPQVVQKVEECGKGVILCQVSSDGMH